MSEQKFSAEQDRKKWAALIGTAVVSAASSVMFIRNGIDKNGLDFNFHWREILSYGGLSTASGAGSYLIWRQWFSGNPGSSETASNNIKTANRFAVIAGTVGLLIGGTAFIGGSNKKTAANSPNNDTTTTTATSSVPVEGSCEIVASFPKHSSDPTIIADAKRLQEWAATLPTPYTGPIDAKLGNQTLVAINAERAHLGLPSSDSVWDATICALTPFGDNNPATP